MKKKNDVKTIEQKFQPGTLVVISTVALSYLLRGLYLYPFHNSSDANH